ncbi:MAG: cation:proton antiporter [Oscillospiraceae bacterium]|nr:cation:proton antiporter [Oscillospiraceae bacterium]
MLFSISIIFLLGLAAGWICQKIRFPALFGMLLAGILIGSYGLDLIDDSILGISAEIRKIALIIILLRAGITLNPEDLKKIGRPAVLLCFLPACFEILGMLLVAPLLLDISALDSAIMGAVISAVSPAIIVPRMIHLIHEKYGTKKGIPQLILAGASVDDVFVIVMFDVFTGIAQGSQVSAITFINIPMSILFGIAVGFMAGKLLHRFFQCINSKGIIKIMILLSVSFIFTAIEDKGVIPFSALIAVMVMGISGKENNASQQISAGLNQLWSVAEIFLFVLVGASVNIHCASEYGFRAVLLIFAVLVFRMAGVLLCLVRTNLSRKERLFCMIAYLPKATVQAAIGGIPLAMGLDCGNMVLTVSVLAILITAPLGAFGIDLSYRKILSREDIS